MSAELRKFICCELLGECKPAAVLGGGDALAAAAAGTGVADGLVTEVLLRRTEPAALIRRSAICFANGSSPPPTLEPDGAGDVAVAGRES